MIVERRTSACTTAESVKPRMSAHKISHVIENAIRSASPIASTAFMEPSLRNHARAPGW
jgi:hypothetical protein